jgi:hypothetical protein
VPRGSKAPNAPVIFIITFVRVITSRMRLPGHVARMGKRRSFYGILLVKPVGSGSLVRQRHSWENCIKTDLQLGVGRLD